eukprot:UN16045
MTILSRQKLKNVKYRFGYKRSRKSYPIYD